jgi:hypothetical protein
MAVRLDPFRRIVNVAWPSAPGFDLFWFEAGNFRQTPIGGGGTFSFLSFSLFFYGNQVGAIAPTWTIRTTFADLSVREDYGTTNNLVVFNNVTTDPTTGKPTPAGFTQVTGDGVSLAPSIALAVPTRVEFINGTAAGLSDDNLTAGFSYAYAMVPFGGGLENEYHRFTAL